MAAVLGTSSLFLQVRLYEAHLPLRCLCMYVEGHTVFLVLSVCQTFPFYRITFKALKVFMLWIPEF